MPITPKEDLIHKRDSRKGHPHVTGGLAVCSAMMDVFTGSMNFSAPAIYTATSFYVFFAINAGIGFLGYLFLFFSKEKKETPSLEPKSL